MIFVDTSAWYASEVEDDINHTRAREFLKKLASSEYGVLVTTDYVLDETLTLLRTRRGLEVALKFFDKLRRSKSIRLIWVGEDIFGKASDLFRRSKGKAWSFTDCTSFALMKELPMSDAYAFDADFKEAGFNPLP